MLHNINCSYPDWFSEVTVYVHLFLNQKPILTVIRLLTQNAWWNLVMKFGDEIWSYLQRNFILISDIMVLRSITFCGFVKAISNNSFLWMILTIKKIVTNSTTTSNLVPTTWYPGNEIATTATTAATGYCFCGYLIDWCTCANEM